MSLAVSHSDILDWRSSWGHSITSSGAGEEFKVLQKELDSLYEHLQQPVTLGFHQQLENRIEELKLKYNYSGWDGYDSEPIDDVSAEVAKHFVRLLPDNIIEPDLVPESGGIISFDWNLSNNYIFSVSVQKDEIVYAGIIGREKFHGTFILGKKLNEKVERVLIEYFSFTH
ncbi:MAG: hypothetical protein A2Z20_03445 [Bdellovibrionales bacterium RBG_16_40_8]|nr:MAG: hypothetical protein A2Z20_03445 [Bdellovibrionales bacterium RBG_16_40_8]